VNNAYDAGLINGVLAAMMIWAETDLRVVVLKGNGKHFQAGADLKWINGVRPKSPEENEAVVARHLRGACKRSYAADPDGALVQGAASAAAPG